jgi:hypothetical protein
MLFLHFIFNFLISKIIFNIEIGEMRKSGEKHKI